MSLVTFSFNIGALPIAYQSAFLTRLFQLNLEYQVLTAPVPASPPAESLPQPDFAPVEGDEPVLPTMKKARKNPWADLTEEQRAERLAKLAAGRAAKKARKMSADSLDAPAPVEAAPVEAAPVDTSSPAPNAPKREASASQAVWNAFVAQVRQVIKTQPNANLSGQVVYRVAKDIRDAGLMESCSAAQIISAYQSRLVRLDEPSSGFNKGHTKAGKKAKAETASTASSPAPAPAPAPATESAVADAASETSSKKPRKNPWADYTPEQKAARLAKMKEARERKAPVLLDAAGNVIDSFVIPVALI
jgi:hypothetical protein